MGAFLRIYGCGFGMPLLSNFYIRPDESLIVQAAIPLFERHGHPGFFAYPALMTEICAALYALFLKPWTDFASQPSAYFMVARWISIVCGTLLVLVVYHLARGICSRNWALAAAGWYAVSPLAVRDAHFGVTDTLMTLLVAASLGCAMRYVGSSETARRRCLILSAVLLGLAVSTKYTAFLASPALVYAIVAKNGFRSMRRLLLELGLVGTLAGAVFAILNPYVFLSRGESAGAVLTIFNAFYRGQGTGCAGWEAARALDGVLLPLLYGPGSWAGLLLAAASAAWLFARCKEKGKLAVLLLGTFPFLAALLPFRHAIPFRYVLPALPGIAVLSAWVMARCCSRRRMAPLVYAMAVAVFVWQTVGAFNLVVLLGREDTRTQAGRWIETNVAPEVPVVLFGPPESEPQVGESATSLQRRIAYAYGLYGRDAGRIVSELYRLLLVRAGAGREVYRNVALDQVPGGRVAVVTAAYPLPTIGSAEARGVPGRVIDGVEFSPFSTNMHGAHLDRIDAFLLPMNPAGRVSGPGPKLTIVVVERSAEPVLPQGQHAAGGPHQRGQEQPGIARD